MLKKFFSPRSVMAIALCLAAATAFSGCDKDDGNDKENGKEPEAAAHALTLNNAPTGNTVNIFVQNATFDSHSSYGAISVAVGYIHNGGATAALTWSGDKNGTYGVYIVISNTEQAKYQNGVKFAEGSATLDWNTMSDIEAEGNDGGVNLTIGNITWAATNVDDYQTFAHRPDMYTKFFQWNRSTAWAEVGTAVTDWQGASITDAAWTINPCPEGWRLPTQDELEALNSAGSSWAAANARGNAVAGRFYGSSHATCSLPNNMAGCIFLPASGYRNNVAGGLANRGKNGYYWSSDQRNETEGYRLDFDNTSSSPDFAGIKANGYPVRCVQVVQ